MAHHHEVNKQKNIEKEKKRKMKKIAPYFYQELQLTSS